MISEQDFIRRVRAEVLPVFLKTEKERKKLLLKGFCLFWLLLITVFLEPFFFLFVFYPFVLTVFKLAKLKKMTQKKILQLLLGLIGDFSTKETVNKSVLKRSCLFPDFDSVHYGYTFSSHFKKTNYTISKVKLYKTGKKNDKLVFNGMLIYIPLVKPVFGYTLLSGKKMVLSPALKRVHLEDVIFHQNYYVCSNDQIEARTLLNPAFMEKLNGLKKYFRNKRLDVSFFGNHLVISVYTRQSLFESFYLFRRINNLKTYSDFYKDISFLYQLIGALNVDNKSLPMKESRRYIRVYKDILLSNRMVKWIDLIILILLFFLIKKIN